MNSNTETLDIAKTTTLSGGITVEYIGQEWCRPSHYWSSNDVAYSGAIAMVTANAGTLILCNVTRHTHGGIGELKYTPVKAKELHVQNEDLTW